MRARYDAALAAMSAGNYQSAIASLTSIVRDAGEGYREAAARLTEAKRKEAVREGARAYGLAQQHEKQNDLNRAETEYRRARELDPSTAIQADLARIAELKAAAGRKACETADAAFVYGNDAGAQTHYAEVIKLLPPGDPCVVTAFERYPQLRRNQ
jgi:tetratricopeptide (TPR) repeat protein